MAATRKVFLFTKGIIAIFLGCLSLTVLSWSMGWDGLTVDRLQPAAHLTHVTFPSLAPQHQQGSREIQTIVAERLKSVVQIRLIKRGNVTFGVKELEDFFLPENHYSLNGRLSNEREVGSGFIISPNGYIVTARHLLTNIDEIHVILNDGSRLPAAIIGSDLRSEIAVLKIDAESLPVISIEDNAPLRAGQLVFAIGSPMSTAFRNSVSLGIVSAIQVIPSQENTTSIWLTDAVMNPGNSGGPLINSKGQLMGMATVPFSVPFSRINKFSGLGTVISTESIVKSAHRIISKGKRGQARLGIQYGPVASSRKKGAAQIIQVEPGSSAYEAGLRQGDIILAINGASLENHLDLSEEIEGKAPGDLISLTIQRGSDAISMQIRLKELEKNSFSESVDAQPEDLIMRELGFAVDDLSLPLVYDLGIPVEEGVVVLYVNPSSEAYREGGIRGGMVIVEMAGEKIRNKSDFMRVFSGMEEERSEKVKLYRPNTVETMLTALIKH